MLLRLYCFPEALCAFRLGSRTLTITENGQTADYWRHPAVTYIYTNFLDFPKSPLSLRSYVLLQFDIVCTYVCVCVNICPIFLLIY